MKKIISILLIAVLAVSVLAGCSSTGSNFTPLSPVFANGVSPDYGNNGIGDSADTEAPVTEQPGEAEQPENNIPEGYATYEDAYVSFICPENIEKKLDFYLLDSDSGSAIQVYAQAVQSGSVDFSRNIYSDISEENVSEMCAEFISSPDIIDNLTISKSIKEAFEITVVKYYEYNGEEVAEDGEEAVVSPRIGHAYIYVESSANADFSEIVISVLANEYPADSISEGYVNFSTVVNNIVNTLSIVTAE